MPTPAISSNAPIDSLLIPSVSANPRQAAATATGGVGADAASDTEPTLDALTQDILKLLRSLASGDVSGAKTDLAKFKANVKAQDTSPTPGHLGRDLTALLRDLTTGNRSAAKTDITQLGADAGSGGTQSLGPFDSLIAKLSDSLIAGSVQGALKDLTSYLVQNGEGTGRLINTTA